mmetsp:Transcript_9444/g.14248  ORF Transcript_9444/g.14248 Transcript_9444/m.14248 type:complete len:1276 (+) Transcript_9444:142-3969(+)
MVDYEGEGKTMPDFKALEKGGNHELPPWAIRQKKVFTSWINNKVKIRNLLVDDLFLDLSDGIILYNLLEVLSRQSLASLGRIKPEKNKIKKIANMNTVWKYLGNTVRLVGIGPTDIVDGNSNLTLGMIWSLIVFFMAKDLGGDSGNDLAALKKRIMNWLNRRAQKHPDINLTNFTDSLADGKVFLAVMEGADPINCPYNPTEDAKENLRNAFAYADNMFGVGSILDPDDPACCSDEKANITYLAELMKVLPPMKEDEEDEEEGLAPNPRLASMKFTNKNVDNSVANLRDLCKVKPDDVEGALQKVSDAMQKAGLRNVTVLNVPKPNEKSNKPLYGHLKSPASNLKSPNTNTKSPNQNFFSSNDNLRSPNHGLKSPTQSLRSPNYGLKSPAQSLRSPSKVNRYPDQGIVLTNYDENEENKPLENESSNRPYGQSLKSPTQSMRSPSNVKRTPAQGSGVAGDIEKDDAGKLRGIEALNKPFVIGERAGPPGAPTVMIYATYATPLDSQEEAEQWYCDPFDGKIEDGRIYAKGAFQDKANVIAPLAAVEALLKGAGLKELPCNLKVLIGGTPPPKSMEGDSPIDIAEGLKNFILCHPDEIGQPDYIIVSDPGGSSLAPDCASVGVGCRGFATVRLTVTTFDASSEENEPSICLYGGPLIDPGFVLCSILASLRDLTSGSLLVELLKSAPDKEICEKLKDVDYVESHIRFQTKYSTETACAKERFSRDGVEMDATLVEHLALLPSVTVATLNMNANKEVGPVSAKFARKAEAVLHLCLSPDQDLHGSIKALRQHCSAVAPFGVELKFSDEKGHKGWSVSPSDRIVECLMQAKAQSQTKRSTSVVSSPEFKPIPAALAQALPKSTVISFGINESESNAGKANESILMDDFTDQIKTTVELLQNLSQKPVKSFNHSFRDVSDGKSSYLKRKDSLEKRFKGRASLSPVAQRKSLLLDDIGRLRTSSSNRLSLPSSPIASPIGSPISFYSKAAAIQGLNEQSFKVAPPPVPSRHTRMSISNDLSALGSRLLQEINLLRSDPPEYARRELEPLLSCFDNGGKFVPPGGGKERITTEGIKALEDALSVLKRMPPSLPLMRMPEMDKAAQDHAMDMSANGQTSHTGTDGSTSGDRISRYGQYVQVAGEIIAFYESSPTAIVCQLLINDGERSRQNRKNLLGDKFKVCGIASATHPKTDFVTVLTLAGGLKQKALNRPVQIKLGPSEEPSAELERVLDSIPSPELVDEVKKAMEGGLAIELDYKPGEVTLVIHLDDGSSQVMSCSWS